jgi:hypothetical protein
MKAIKCAFYNNKNSLSNKIARLFLFVTYTSYVYFYKMCAHNETVCG